MPDVVATQRGIFSSLKVPNYRRYFIGQMISMCGTWMQSVGQAWLVLGLTGSGTALGLVTALQFLPVLLLGPFAGVLVDRLPKRRVLAVTQTVAGTLALVLAILVATDTVQLWQVYVLAVGLGLVSTVDVPTRQIFVLEMVGKDDLNNAVTLNAVMVNTARVLGPALAGVLISAFELAVCFFINAASYVAVLVALALIAADQLSPSPRAARSKGQLREGLRYVQSTPILRDALVMMAIIGTLSYEFQVLLPLLARFTFHGTAATYSALTAAMGAGAVVGGLVTAGRRRRRPRARQPPQRRSARAGPGGVSVRRDDPDRRRRPDPRCGVGGHGPRRRRLGRVPVARHDLPADRGRSGDARSRDGAVVGGLPRVHPHRWADRGVRRPARRSPLGPRTRRGGGPRCWSHRAQHAAARPPGRAGRGLARLGRAPCRARRHAVRLVRRRRQRRRADARPTPRRPLPRPRHPGRRRRRAGRSLHNGATPRGSPATVDRRDDCPGGHRRAPRRGHRGVPGRGRPRRGSRLPGQDRAGPAGVR